jgi:hypothetical protein
MLGVARALALTNQELLRPCCHLGMVKRRLMMIIQAKLKVVAHVGEDLRRQAYHRFG